MESVNQIHSVIQEFTYSAKWQLQLSTTELYNKTRSSMVLKAIRQKVYQKKRKTRHFLPLKRIREEVVLKPNKLLLSTILFQTSSVKAHMGCVDLLRTLELSDKLPGMINQ